MKVNRLDSEVQSRFTSLEEMVQANEKLASRLADDSITGQEELRKLFQQQEFRITEIFSYIQQGEEEGIENGTGGLSSKLKRSIGPMQMSILP